MEVHLCIYLKAFLCRLFRLYIIFPSFFIQCYYYIQVAINELFKIYFILYRIGRGNARPNFFINKMYNCEHRIVNISDRSLTDMYYVCCFSQSLSDSVTY